MRVNDLEAYFIIPEDFPFICIEYKFRLSLHTQNSPQNEQ